MPNAINKAVGASPVPGTNKKKSNSKHRSLQSGRPPFSSSTTSASAFPGSREGTRVIGKNDNEKLSIFTGKSSGSSKKSSKATKALINSHHNLHKSRAKAVAAGDTNLVCRIDEQISQLGGLQAYQQASLTGQSADRGGDSSALLVRWLQELIVESRPINSLSKSNSTTEVTSGNNTSGNGNADTTLIFDDNHTPLRVLEVGALSSRNAISRAAITKQKDNSRQKQQQPQSQLIESVRRIDLKSQDPNTIEEIDFMDLPVPETNTQKYDVISLSLVLNYVPDARGRGEMLRRTRDFLRINDDNNDNNDNNDQNINEPKDGPISRHDATKIKDLPVPCLFVVLPLPCISNSRYLNEDRFRELMALLGYASVRVHQSAKLHYELFHWNNRRRDHRTTDAGAKQGCFKKVEVNPGKGRNNFCITLDDAAVVTA